MPVITNPDVQVQLATDVIKVIAVALEPVAVVATAAVVDGVVVGGEVVQDLDPVAHGGGVVGWDPDELAGIINLTKKFNWCQFLSRRSNYLKLFLTAFTHFCKLDRFIIVHNFPVCKEMGQLINILSQFTLKEFNWITS
jgi:hypothetical protein